VVPCGSVVPAAAGSGAVVLEVLGGAGGGGGDREGSSLGISVLSVGIGRSVEEDIGVGCIIVGLAAGA